MLKVDSLSKSFGNTEVLKDVSLEIESGQTTVILGPSGSGKSTLLRCLNLLETPQSGSLTIENDTVEFGRKLSDAQVRQIRQHSAMVFQQFNLFPNYTALKNVALAPVLNGKMSESESEQNARDLLAKVGLADKADSYPDNLSGGQQQRVVYCPGTRYESGLSAFRRAYECAGPRTGGGGYSRAHGTCRRASFSGDRHA